MNLEAQRPKIAAEVRAWVLASLTIASTGIGLAWWAATLTAEVRALKEIVVRDYILIREEQRALRADMDKLRADMQKYLIERRP